MNIQLLGISHKTAPVQIRALFAFTDENKKELMTRICTQKEIRECVLLSTCNRTELYTVSEENISVRSVMAAMQRIMLDMAGIGDAGVCRSICGFIREHRRCAICFMWRRGWIQWFWVRIRSSVR